MPARSSPFVAPLRTCVRELGFTVSGPTWVRDQQTTIALINLQKSAFGGAHYLNIGLILKALGPPARLLERHCHLRLRAPFPGSRPSALEQALNLDYHELSFEQRVNLISRYLRDDIDPLLRRWDRFEALAADHDAGKLAQAAIQLPLRDMLGRRGSDAKEGRT